MEFDNELLEKLAETAHNIWMEGKLRDGWKQGGEIDKEKKIHNCLIPYQELSEADKESDRDMVRGIPRIIELAGYKLCKNDQ
jgi:hypothetical protein